MLKMHARRQTHETFRGTSASTRARRSGATELQGLRRILLDANGAPAALASAGEMGPQSTSSTVMLWSCQSGGKIDRTSSIVGGILLQDDVDLVVLVVSAEQLKTS